MKNVPRVTPDECLFSGSTNSSGNKMLQRQDQKSKKWIMDLFSKFFKVKELVLHTCAGTLASAKVCLQLPEHCKLIECTNTSACFQYPLPSLVEVYAKQALIPDSDIAGSREASETRKELLKKMGELLARKRVESWTMPPGLVPTQPLPVHIMSFLGNMCKDATLFERYRLIAALQWSDRWCRRFFSINLKTLPAHD